MGTLSHLNKYLYKYRLLLLLGVGFIALSTVFKVYMPVEVKKVTDLLADYALDPDGQDQDKLMHAGLVAAGLYVLFGVLNGLFTFFMRQTIIVTSRHIEYDLKNEVYDHYQQLSLGFYRSNRIGDLMNRVSEDVSKVRMYLGPGIMYTVNLVILFIMTIVMMVRANPELTLYSLLPLPLMSYIIYRVSKNIQKRSLEIQQTQSELSSLAQEAVSGIRVIKSYVQEENLAQFFGHRSNEYKKRNLKLALINALFFPTVMLLIGLTTMVTIYVGGRQAIGGEISYGEVVQFVIYVNMLTWPFASVGWVTALVQQAAASQARINEFLETEPEIKSPLDGATDLEGDIELDKVSYTYPSTGIKALKEVSIKIPRSSTLGVVGRTGSGKSTLIQMLCRQLDPDHGAVRINGHDLRKVDLDAWHTQLGIVPQEAFLFSDTIHNNISFAVDQATSEEDVRKAAKQADVDKDISRLPEGYQTLLGERGINLSGGQKQRVSIARALLKDSPVLLFDDCLSAVDTQTEENILRSIIDINRSKTSVIVSHRISSVKHADHIVFLEDGKVVEQGDHETLLANDKKYAAMYRRQLLEDQ